MGVVIAQEPLSRRYEARWWSLAACFHFACYVALVIVPFIIAYSSQCARAPSARASRHRAGRSHPSREPNLPSRPRRAGAALWLKEKTGREQPEAHFQHEVLVLAQGADPSQQYAFSTSPSVNALFGDAMRAMSVRLSEADADHDGRPEQLHVEVSLPLRAGEEVVGVTVLVALSYALQDTARFSANATAIAQHMGAGAGSGVELFGDLELRAARALPPVSAGSSGPAKLMGVSAASTLDGLSPAALIARCAAVGAAGAAGALGTQRTEPARRALRPQVPGLPDGGALCAAERRLALGRRRLALHGQSVDRRAARAGALPAARGRDAQVRVGAVLLLLFPALVHPAAGEVVCGGQSNHAMPRRRRPAAGAQDQRPRLLSGRGREGLRVVRGGWTGRGREFDVDGRQR